MNKYFLKKGDELVEVLEGREARRDQLIAAGYEWVNAPEPDALSALDNKAKRPKEVKSKHEE